MKVPRPAVPIQRFDCLARARACAPVAEKGKRTICKHTRICLFQPASAVHLRSQKLLVARGRPHSAVYLPGSAGASCSQSLAHNQMLPGPPSRAWIPRLVRSCYHASPLECSPKPATMFAQGVGDVTRSSRLLTFETVDQGGCAPSLKICACLTDNCRTIAIAMITTAVQQPVQQ